MSVCIIVDKLES